MKYLMCIALLLSLTACYEEDTSKGKGPADGGEEQYQDVTDYSRCNSAGPRPVSVEGTWSSAGRTETGMTSRIYWTFTNRRLYVSNTCSLAGRQVTARVMVPAEYTGDYVASLGTASKTAEINEPDFQLSCTINVEEFAANYYFNNRCLVLQVNGYDRPITLVPEQ
jgi:hypothetical protein